MMSDYRVATNDGYVWVSKDALLEAKDKRIAELQARVDKLEAALPVAHIIGLIAARQRRANSEVVSGKND